MGRSGSIGPYVIDSVTDEEVRYLANELYFAASNTQPREIVERYYSDQRRALQALRSGQVAMLDRVVPWEVEALRASGDIVVERYAVPTIHCLIPNFNNPLLARAHFRRALVHGINRTDVLRNQMLRGAPAAFGQVISGPFPRGESIEDPVGYAYNDDVEPYPYNQGLAIIRAAMARQELQASEAGKDAATLASQATQPGMPEIPKLVLAHPPHDLARVACRAIQKQLQAIRVPIELKELSPDAIATRSGDWDLLFAELNLWEPVIDARRLLGPLGLTGNCSQYMDLLLRQLAQSEDWRRVREKLLNVHRQAHEDLAILPLWQLVDHFAYHKSLQGVGKRPAMLYQHIEAWRAPPGLRPKRYEPPSATRIPRACPVDR